MACQRENGERKGEREGERKKVAASFTLLSVIVGGQNKQGDDIIKPETERFLKAFVCRVERSEVESYPKSPRTPFKHNLHRWPSLNNIAAQGREDKCSQGCRCCESGRRSRLMFPERSTGTESPICGLLHVTYVMVKALVSTALTQGHGFCPDMGIFLFYSFC